MNSAGLRDRKQHLQGSKREVSSSSWGYAIAGWVLLGKIPSRNGWFGDTPILGNHQMNMCSGIEQKKQMEGSSRTYFWHQKDTIWKDIGRDPKEKIYRGPKEHMKGSNRAYVGSRTTQFRDQNYFGDQTEHIRRSNIFWGEERKCLGITRISGDHR